jgi:hypothetical protein
MTVKVSRHFVESGEVDPDPYFVTSLPAEVSADRLEYLEHCYGCSFVSAVGASPVVVRFFDQDAGWVQEVHEELPS